MSAASSLGIATYSWPNGHVVVRLVGDVDASTVHRLIEEITRLDVGDGDDVVVHMEDVTFLDTVGAGALVAAANSVAERGCSFAISSPSVQAAAVIELAGLGRMLAASGDDDVPTMLPMT